MNCRGTSGGTGNRSLRVGDAELQHTDRQAPHALFVVICSFAVLIAGVK